MDKSYLCLICDSTFTKKSNLYRHRAEQHGVKMLRCHVCEKLFKRRSNLRRHLEIRHTFSKKESLEFSIRAGMLSKNPLSHSALSPVSSDGHLSNVSEDDEVLDLIQELDDLPLQIPDYNNNIVDTLLEDTGNSTLNDTPEFIAVRIDAPSSVDLASVDLADTHGPATPVEQLPMNCHLLFALGLVMSLL